MKLNDLTWPMLEAFEDGMIKYRSFGYTHQYRGAIMVARDAGIVEDLPEWAQGDKLDKGDINLEQRDELLTMAAELFTHVNAAKAPTDPN